MQPDEPGEPHPIKASQRRVFGDLSRFIKYNEVEGNLLRENPSRFRERGMGWLDVLRFDLFIRLMSHSLTQAYES